jgi:hypothetical protein
MSTLIVLISAALLAAQTTTTTVPATQKPALLKKLPAKKSAAKPGPKAKTIAPPPASVIQADRDRQTAQKTAAKKSTVARRPVPQKSAANKKPLAPAAKNTAEPGNQ